MNLTIFLAALALVESGNDDRAWNRDSGARGAYQITLKVWKQHSVLPFRQAHDPIWAYRFASRHIDWLKTNGVPDKPYDLALAWHEGLRGYKRQRTNPFPRGEDHARRVEAIYNLALSDPTVLKPARRKR